MKNKYLITSLLALFLCVSVFAQNPTDQLWHLKPYSKKGESGIGLEEAKELVKDKKANTVVVAIIDAGVDIYHPDLKNMLWVNEGEIADNNIDDDGNGYIDDVYGWNFLGETTFDCLELTRQYASLNAKYELKTADQVENKEEYARYQEIKEEFLQKSTNAKMSYERYSDLLQGAQFLEDAYGEDMTVEELQNHKSKSKYDETAKRMLLGIAEKTNTINYTGLKSQLQGAVDYFEGQHKYYYNAEFDPRAEKVGDDYENAYESNYGNSKVYYGEKFSSHGTHVAGIVAADASNDFGAAGICQSCEIMSIRTVPEGDERDKDVANSIRYAVDNGAQIINMSFGKAYASNTKVVREAIAYAESKNVLLVHAAGNSSQNNDIKSNYPNDFGNSFNNWIEVGASSWEKKPNSFATFTNYGKEEIDLFAPGVAIYSTTPENQYEAFNGTSMASPVVAGVAAFLWSYYPELTAAQVKQILEESAIPIKGRSRTPGAKKKTRACKISRTGGEVNLPAALRLAAEMTANQG